MTYEEKFKIKKEKNEEKKKQIYSQNIYLVNDLKRTKMCRTSCSSPESISLAHFIFSC